MLEVVRQLFVVPESDCKLSKSLSDHNQGITYVWIRTRTAEIPSLLMSNHSISFAIIPLNMPFLTCFVCLSPKISDVEKKAELTTEAPSPRSVKIRHDLLAFFNSVSEVDEREANDVSSSKIRPTNIVETGFAPPEIATRTVPIPKINQSVPWVKLKIDLQVTFSSSSDVRDLDTELSECVSDAEFVSCSFSVGR